MGCLKEVVSFENEINLLLALLEDGTHPKEMEKLFTSVARYDGADIGVLAGINEEGKYDFETGEVTTTSGKKVTPCSINEEGRVYRLADGKYFREDSLNHVKASYAKRRKGFVEDLVEIHKSIANSKYKIIKDTCYTNNPYLYIIINYFRSIEKKVKIPIKDIPLSESYVSSLFALILTNPITGRTDKVKLRGRFLEIKGTKKKIGKFKLKKMRSTWKG